MIDLETIEFKNYATAMTMSGNGAVLRIACENSVQAKAIIRLAEEETDKRRTGTVVVIHPTYATVRFGRDIPNRGKQQSELIKNVLELEVGQSLNLFEAPDTRLRAHIHILGKRNNRSFSTANQKITRLQ